MLNKIQKTKEEWRLILPPQIFAITRNMGTEPAFRNLYWDNKAEGIYRCSNCGLHLFDSGSKFDAGTGWPSFYQPFENDRIIASLDPDGIRTAANCGRCDAHLGHIFEDGPPPTGLRYCMDSTSLIFIPQIWNEN